MARGTVLFDLDGTLVDSAPDLADALDELLQERGLAPLGLVEARGMIGLGIGNFVREGLAAHGVVLDGCRLEKATQRFLEFYDARLSRKTRPYPGTAEALAALRRDGWRLVVCTNKLESSARRILADLGLLNEFALVAGPDTFGVAKPDPRHLLRCLSDAQEGARRAVALVGDSAVDLEAGQAAGIPVALVDWGYSRKPIRELGADVVLSSFDQVPAAVEALVGSGSEDG